MSTSENQLPLDLSEPAKLSESEKLPEPENPSKKGTLVLTPNASLAQQLRRQNLIKLNQSSAPATKAYMLQSWLADSIQPGLHPKLSIATDNQLRFIWEQVISEQRDKDQELQQLNPAYLAGQALAAWRSLLRWQISLDELAKAETGQLLSFKKWVVEFEKRLAAKNLSTIELELVKKLEIKSLDANLQQLPLVKTYAFIEPLPPLWHAWLAHKFERIEELEYLGPKESPKDLNNCQLCATDSPDQELEYALLWAKSTLSSEPQSRIAIIDIKLKDNLKATTRRARDILDESRVRFSRDISLSSEGPVQTALALLSLNESQLDLALARQIIQSPLWGEFKTEYSVRAKWDRDLCAMQSAQVSRSDFLGLISSEDSEELLARLTTTFSETRRNKKLSPLAWCDIFQEQLGKSGCFEHFSEILRERWLDALGDFASLGDVSGDMGISDALRQLKNCCSAPVARAGSASPGVAFLDTIEAAADYSHIWILGMDNLSWPGAVSLNPLLPVSLQIQYLMPHSQPQLETELTRRLIERLTLAANHVVFSYSRLHDDLEQSPCAFVAHFPQYVQGDIAELQNPDSSMQIIQKETLEWVDCSQAPAVPEDKKDIQGGAGLLKTMAASPFDAFALWRLGAYQLDEPKIGLSALDRGNLAHNVLERIWKELGDSKTLNSLEKSAIETLCATAADKELKRFQSRQGWLSQRFAELEVKRLAELAVGWLNFERERDDFVVELTEEKLTANIGGLTFKLRLDRLDRLPNGELILIDYKTGNSLSRRYWLDMPPAEPQLPLYAITLDSTPNAICFAKVRADKMEFIGIGQNSENIKGFEQREDWPDLMAAWKESLETLAISFINGDVRAFETKTGFGQKDPLAPLHRFAEFDQVEAFRLENDSV